MVEKNKEYILDIIAQGYEGEGIAKIDNTFPVFIEGALVGEKVKVKIVKVKEELCLWKACRSYGTIKRKMYSRMWYI